MLPRGNAGRGQHHQCIGANASTLSEFFFGIGCPFFGFEHLPPEMSVHVPDQNQNQNQTTSHVNTAGKPGGNKEVHSLVVSLQSPYARM